MNTKTLLSQVVAWKEFGISNAYTLEMSLGGGDFGEDPATQAPIHFTIEVHSLNPLLNPDH